jgi:hypothetical protein
MTLANPLRFFISLFVCLFVCCQDELEIQELYFCFRQGEVEVRNTLPLNLEN